MDGGLRMSDLEDSLKSALMSGIQTGVGETMHPDAKALVCIAFKDGLSAERFQRAYVAVRRRIEDGDTS